jgi:hypothetical protein
LRGNGYQSGVVAVFILHFLVAILSVENGNMTLDYDVHRVTWVLVVEYSLVFLEPSELNKIGKILEIILI